MENENSSLSVGVIMDGNRRWAKQKGKQGFEGHTAGYAIFKDFLNWAREFGVKTVYSYVFSEENWKRSEEEVSFLISLIKKIIFEEDDKFVKEKVKIVFAGNISKFPKDIYEKMIELQNKTKENSGFTLVLCLSYGGRGEIVYAVNQFLEKNNNAVKITEKDISDNLYSSEIKDPDIIIRTSGEQRLSGFLPWQSVYSEFFFTETMWPDFTKEEFKGILESYNKRQRRMGK